MSMHWSERKRYCKAAIDNANEDLRKAGLSLRYEIYQAYSGQGLVRGKEVDGEFRMETYSICGLGTWKELYEQVAVLSSVVNHMIWELREKKILSSD